MKPSIGGVVALSVLLGAISLAGLAEGNPYCVSQIRTVEIFIDVNVTCYACFQSKNYIQDLVPAPTDAFAVTFSNSDIPVLKNASFSKFDERLIFIGLHNVGLTDIEDHAFEGLPTLLVLAIIDNKLEVIKGEWFRDAPNLQTVSFQGNHIHEVEGTFFSIIKETLKLDFAGNQLTCLPTTEFEQFDVEILGIENNPWTPECSTWLENTIQEKNITKWNTSLLGPIIGTTDNITVGSMPVELPVPDTEAVDQAGPVNDALTNFEIHSLEDLCAFLKGHTSSFYEC